MVPIYQRPYVWNRTKQWEPLWEDVSELTERLVEEYESTGDWEKAQKKVAPHFLGAVVLEPISVGAGQVDKRHIIDGQQRLTTLQLLIAAVAAEAVKHDSPAGKLLSKLLRNDPDLIDPSRREMQYKVWPTKHDRDAFVAAMSEGSADGRTAKAFTYFRGAAQTWAAPLVEDSIERDKNFTALQLVIRTLLKLVVINLV